MGTKIVASTARTAREKNVVGCSRLAANGNE
jgi:hypothetical protein